MTRVPSVKGAVFAGVVEAVRKLLDSGELTREGASRWLQPADLPFLDAQVSIAGWYPIGVFDRMSLLMRDVVGGGNNDYLRNLGRESAKRLLAAGIYSQFEYLHRITALNEKDPKTRSEAFARDLRRLTTMSGAIYNFGVWTIEQDPDYTMRHRIVVSDAAAFSDVCCFRAEGFINQMGYVRNTTPLWKWERVSREVVHFRMTREV